MSQWWEGESTVPGEPTAPGGSPVPSGLPVPGESTVPNESTEQGAPRPGRPSRWLVLVGGLWLVAAVAALVAVVVLRSGSSGDGVDALPPKGTVRLEPVTYASPAPFMPSVVAASSRELPKLAGRVVSGERPAVSGGSVQGDAALLYATASQSPCDRAKLLAKLHSDSRLAAAWSSAAGVDPSGIDALVGSLTPVMLRVDTAVTNHVYQSGSAHGYQSVLQAGTPVMVDPTGLPRVQCSCGNPLLAPASTRSSRTDGERWKSFAHDQVVSVTPAPAPVAVFDTVDVETAKPAKTGSGSNTVLDGTLVAATDGLFVAPAAGGDLVKVLDQSVDAVFDDGRGGLVYTLADPGNPYRNDRPSAPERTVIWHLAAGAAEATQLITPPPGGWDKLLGVGRLGDRTYVIYAPLEVGPMASDDSSAAVGPAVARDFDSGTETTLKAQAFAMGAGIRSVSFSGDRLGLGHVEEIYEGWSLFGLGLTPIDNTCSTVLSENGGSGTPTCPVAGVLDDQGEIVGIDTSVATGAPVSTIRVDPATGQRGSSVTLAGLQALAAYPDVGQFRGGRLSLGRYEQGADTMTWRIFDLSNGADVTPPIGNHKVNMMWMLNAPIVRPQAAATPPATPTTPTSVSGEQDYLTKVLHSMDPSTADLIVSSPDAGADTGISTLLKAGKLAGWALFQYTTTHARIPASNDSSAGYDLAFWAPTKEAFCAKVRATGQGEYESKELPGC